MMVELTTNERNLLVRVLEERHRQLERELWRTDHHHFKDLLREEQKSLEQVLARLGASLSEAA
jgi:hypothetical protein